jgi:hypothetical protein
MGNLRLESTSTTCDKYYNYMYYHCHCWGAEYALGLQFSLLQYAVICAHPILYHAPVAVTAECSLVQSSNFLDKNEKATWYPSQVSISGFGVLY